MRSVEKTTRYTLPTLVLLAVEKMSKFMKIYTKTGDDGSTLLWGGGRVSKAHLRIETYGTVDELNSYMGLLRDHTDNSSYRSLLKIIQDTLFVVGSNLAANPEKSKLATPPLDNKEIELLEQTIDDMDANLPPLRHFILPGGHPTVSFCHLARCVCRRAERLCVALAEQEYVAPNIIPYLNRLADFLFVLARQLSQDLGAEEIIWKGNEKKN